MINRICPPHRWFISGGGKDGIVIAKCLDCTARQYQPMDTLRETLIKAAKLNVKYHYTRIIVGKKMQRFNYK